VPYARNADLPSAIRNPLPPAAQELFRRVVNAALAQRKTEEQAFRIAWSQVGQQYKKPADGGKWVHKVINSTLYVRRNVENSADIIKWAKDHGFEKTLLPSDMHVTVAYSKEAIDWPEPDDDGVVIKSHRDRAVESLGDGGAVVLKFHSASLTRRWQELIDKGASWDYEGYIPHMTITYEAGDTDLEKLAAYDGPIVLGPEVFEEVKEDIEHPEKAEADQTMANEPTPTIDKLKEDVDKAIGAVATAAATFKSSVAALAKHTAPPQVSPAWIMKVDSNLGLVFGWAIISKQDDEDYYDLQGDHIPEEAMLEASLEFMEKRRTLKLMHKGEKQGNVVFAWPLTTEVAKAMGLKTSVTGLMIAVKPANKKILQDIKSGKLTGFSIGGQRLEDEDVENE